MRNHRRRKRFDFSLASLAVGLFAGAFYVAFGLTAGPAGDGLTYVRDSILIVLWMAFSVLFYWKWRVALKRVTLLEEYIAMYNRGERPRFADRVRLDIDE